MIRYMVKEGGEQDGMVDTGLMLTKPVCLSSHRVLMSDVFNYPAVGWSLMKNPWQWTVNGSDLLGKGVKECAFSCCL